MKNYIFLLLVFSVFYSCTQDIRYSSNDTCELTLQKFVSFPIGGDVNPISNRAVSFTDDQQEFLAYVNPQNHLLIFSLDSNRLVREVHFDRDGPNEVLNVVGLYFHNADSIYILSGVPNLIILSDIDGNVKDRIDISEMNIDDKYPDLFISIHQNNNPVILIDSELHFPIVFRDALDGKMDRIPLNITHGLLNKELDFSSISMPLEHQIKSQGDLFYSRVYNGARWVYSFFLENKIYAIDNNDNKVEVKECKSRYTSGKKLRPLRSKSKSIYAGGLSERYLSIVYDPWRKVYYRIFLPEEEVTKEMSDDDIISLLECPTVFSVMILDENLFVIGETLMEERSYLPEMFFVSSEGLHFGLHIDHPEFSMDTLKFARFTVKEK